MQWKQKKNQEALVQQGGLQKLWVLFLKQTLLSFSYVFSLDI